MKLEKMLKKLHEFGETKSFSEDFLTSEFGRDGFNTLKTLGCITSRCGSNEKYVEELQHVSPQYLAEFRQRIRNNSFNPKLYTSIKEKAEELPLVYYPKDQSCISGFVLNINHIPELEQNPLYITTSNPCFDNVMGYKIDEGSIVLRYSGIGYYPRNCHVLAKKFGGRIPKTDELLKIIEKLDCINTTALSIDEDFLPKGQFLVLEKNSASYFTTINIEDPNDRKQIKYNEKCCFVVVK